MQSLDQRSEPRGSKNPCWVAEQFALALGDNMLESLRIKLEHDARIDLFIVNAQVVPGFKPLDTVVTVEQLELFPVFTGLNTSTSRVIRIR